MKSFLENLEEFEKNIHDKPLKDWIDINVDYSLYFNYIKNSHNKTSKDHFVLGFCYFEGIGTDKDLQKSFYYLNLSAKKNYSYGLSSLGIYYYLINHDNNLAFYYLNLASKQKEYIGKLCLGNYYLHVRKDIENAKYWYNIAISEGCLDSISFSELII